MRSRDSSVGIAMGYSLNGRGLVSSRCKIFFFYSTVSRLVLGPTQSLVQWVSVIISPEVKRPDREADHSRPSGADGKNDGAMLPLPPYVFIAWCLINYALGQIYHIYLCIVSICWTHLVSYLEILSSVGSVLILIISLNFFYGPSKSISPIVSNINYNWNKTVKVVQVKK
jgi:hypothetical protein